MCWTYQKQIKLKIIIKFNLNNSINEWNVIYNGLDTAYVHVETVLLH